MAVLGKGCRARREEQGPASAVLSYPAAGRGPPPGGTPGCLYAAGLPAPALAEPPGAGSAASQWSPARGEERILYQKREGNLGHKICVAEIVLYKYWFLGWVGKSRGGAQLSRVVSRIPCHLKSSSPPPAPPSPSALLTQGALLRPLQQLLPGVPTSTSCCHTHMHTCTHTQFSPPRLRYFKNTYSKSCPTLIFRYHTTRSRCPWNKIQPPSMADKGLLPPSLSRDLSQVLSACPRSLRQLFLLPELFFTWLASFLFNGFIEIGFIYPATDPFKADNSMVFSIFTGLCHGYCDKFLPFLLATETSCIPSASLILTSNHSSTL